MTETTIKPATSFGMKRLNRDAAFMAASSVANALLGILFWAFAAKVFRPEQLGVMTAVLAAIVSAGLVVAAGVGDAYTALLPAVGSARLSVYRRGQRVWLGLALIAGIGSAIVTISLLPQVRTSILVAVLVAVGVLAWSAFLLQNYTLISIGRARWLPATNIGIGVGKIVTLLALAVMLGWHSVELAFIISAVLVVLLFQPAIVRVLDSGQDLPKTATMPVERASRELNRLVVRTLTSATLSLGVLNLTPFLVTVFAGPKQGALFSISLTIVQTLDIVISALACSLLVHASGAPEQAAKMARTVLAKASAVAALGTAVIIPVAPLALRMLNPEYGGMGGTGVIALLCGGCILRTIYVVWAALQRSRRNMKVILALDFTCAMLLLFLIPDLCGMWGAFGGALALFVADLVRCTGAIGHFLVTRRRPTRIAAAPASADVPGMTNLTDIDEEIPPLVKGGTVHDGG